MAAMKVVRWKKYGYDRLYVSDEADQPVGWMDIVSGEVSVVEPGREPILRQAIADFQSTTISTAPTPPPPSPPVSPPATGRDLSLNRPGETVRARATEEWAAAKERHPVIAPIARFLEVKTDERAWRVGAAGEEKTGPKLEKLIPHGWRVLHSVPVGTGDSDIDHVLIGPGGVFTVNTKYHPGARVWVAEHQIRVNGTPVPYLRNSRHEGERASRLLTAAAGFPVDVTPCLIILTGGLQPNVTYKQQPDDVLVLDAWDVPRVFKRRTGIMDPGQVDAVFEVARWETTWTFRPEPR